MLSDLCVLGEAIIFPEVVANSVQSVGMILQGESQRVIEPNILISTEPEWVNCNLIFKLYIVQK